MKRTSRIMVSFLLLVCLSHAATLTVSVNPANVGIHSITPSAGVYEYEAGQTVNLSASSFIQCPSVYRFNHWTGDVANPNAAATAVLMDANKTITAVFTLAAPVCGDQCHPNFTTGDLNHDCIVDLGDFAVLASRWMNCTKPECDEVLPQLDTEPPLPNPTTLTVVRVIVNGQSYDVLTAGVVADDSGVEYQFECINIPALISNSVCVDWINTENMVEGIRLFGAAWYPNGAAKIPNKVWISVAGSGIHTYRVRTRDQSSAHNTGQWSNTVNSNGQVVNDVTPPSPNPAQWLTPPYRIGQNSITMTAVTAADAEGNGVQYCFECLEDSGLSSVWLSSPTFTLYGLAMNRDYTFRVKYRDLSSNYNQTQYSNWWSVSTNDFNPPVPNPAEWEIQPYQNSATTIRMVAKPATDPEGNGVFYSFSCIENPALSTPGLGIASNEYITPAANLLDRQTYTFTVRYRDNSMSQNQTAASDAAAVTIVTIDFNPPLATIPLLTGVRLIFDGQYYHILTATDLTGGVIADPEGNGEEFQYECTSTPALITNWVKTDWVNIGNMYESIAEYGKFWYPNYSAKVPYKIYIPIAGSQPQTYRVRVRDQSPAQNTTGWSLPVTVQ